MKGNREREAFLSKTSNGSSIAIPSASCLQAKAHLPKRVQLPRFA